MATITEDYVSLETAKLLREKGFKEPTLAYAYSDNMIGYYSQPRVTEDYNVKAGRYPLPTLQMSRKWLEKIHGIHLNIIYNKIYDKGYWGKGHWTWDNEEYSSYEEACETAIKYCLKNLI
jgi:hypothetical protein